MLEWSIRMQINAFGYAGRKIWLMKWRVSGCIEEAFGCLKANSNAQESIQILEMTVARRVSGCFEEHSDRH